MTASRRLGPILLIAIGVDFIIGLGIYALPGKVFAHLGHQSFWIFPLSGILLSFIALNIWHLAGRTERNGGTYIYLRQSGFRELGFAIGWLNWAGATLGLGVFVAVFAKILSEAMGLNHQLALMVGISSILVLTALNIKSVNIGSKVVAAFTLLKLIPLVVLAIGGLIVFTPPSLSYLTPNFSSHSNWSAAILLALFVCQGFEYIPIVAGEAKSPCISIPKATIVSLWIAIGVYTIMFLGMQPNTVAGSDHPLQVHAVAVFGEAGGLLVGGFALFSLLGILAGRALTAPRLLEPMCEDGYFPKIIAKHPPKLNSPVLAVALTLVFALPFVFLSNLDAFIALAGLGVALNYLIICGLNLLWQKTSKQRSYLLPMCGLLISMFFILQVPSRAWLHLLIMLTLGYLVRFLFLSLHRVVGFQQASNSFH